jgi:hypothetical protein
MCYESVRDSNNLFTFHGLFFKINPVQSWAKGLAMARSNDPIAKLYEHRRQYPDARPHDRFPKPQDANRYRHHEEIQRPQSREDQHGPGYNNDVSKRSWLQNGDGTTKSKYDFGGSWRRADKGDKR